MLKVLWRNSQSGRDLYNALREHIPVSRTRGTKTLCWNVHENGGLNSRVVSKLRQLELMKEAGVQCVPFYTSLWDALTAHQKVFGRLPSHTQGRDIRVLTRQNLDRNRPQEFFTGVMPKQREYRIHVFNGLAVRCGEKVGNGDPDGIWNLGTDFQIRYENSGDIPRAVKELAKAAVSAVGYQFGAVDVLTSNGQHYVLEINKCPSLHGATLAKYVSKILEWYNNA